MSNEPEKPNPAPEENPPPAPENSPVPEPSPAPENPPAPAPAPTPAPATEAPPPAPVSGNPPSAPASTSFGGSAADKKLIAGLLGILLGSLGIHKFYLGYQKEGLIMLLFTLVIAGGISLITCGLGMPLFGVMGVIGLIEGILYLTKSDEEFTSTYLTGQKPWF